MRFIRGFEQQILEALDIKNSDMVCEALLAAGNWGLAKAWPAIACLFSDSDIDKPTLLAVIDVQPWFANLRAE